MDFATLLDAADCSYDLALAGGQLRKDDGLRTAVVVSLLTDRRAAPDDELPAGEVDRRGWWGDAAAPAGLDAGAAGARIGSRLWLLSREKQTGETLNRARDYATEALAWLIEDGWARSVDVIATWVAQGRLEMTVDLTLIDGPDLSMVVDATLEG